MDEASDCCSVAHYCGLSLVAAVKPVTACYHGCESHACTLNLWQNSECCSKNTQQCVHLKTDKISTGILQLHLGFLRCSVSILAPLKKYSSFSGSNCGASG